jgi:hypothetical protein
VLIKLLATITLVLAPLFVYAQFPRRSKPMQPLPY